MLPATLDYLAPTTVRDAVEALAAQPNAAFTAGSYRLVIDLKMRRLDIGTLVDLRKIPELYEVALRSDGTLEIGAMASLDGIARHERIAAEAPALAQAAARTGDPQIRNMAALGGTLAYDGSSSDVAAALLALGAVIHTEHPQGRREVEAGAFFTPDGGTALRRDEIITRVTLPASSRRGSYEQFADPASLAAIIGAAAAVTLDADAVVVRCGLAVSGTVVQARRLAEAESVLIGGVLDDESIGRAAAVAARGIDWLPGARASAPYRTHRLGIMVARALRRLL